ncbi:response regulator [uncultured Devosia sp.]|uniref:response regulator n=1 Tax=uncultured Devosia sp. TaxID=211434 RepID=UPI00260F1DEB|nr:response regulator [uncultured Devosia sp.]
MQITPLRGPGTTILVVDDDALITLNTVDVLKDLGHTAIEAFSAVEALALMEKHPDIGVLITDYAMPGMNGLELAEAARRLKPDLPVLLTSGYSELPEEQPCAYPRLDKPYREDELAVRLGELLSPKSDA